MLDLTPPAKRRLTALADEQADRFETTLLQNVVHDRLPEDEVLRLLVKTAENAYSVEEDYDVTAAVAAGADEAAEVLRWAVGAHAHNAVREILAEVADEIDEWDDAWSESEIAAAKVEIKHVRNAEVPA